MARILLGVTGGIAAYKACTLVRLLVRAGHEVEPVLTAGAERFVARETFVALARRPESQDPYPHLGHWDLLVVAPLTANTLARMAHGLADDVLTEAVLAHAGPVLVAPAMNTRMWLHPATQANVATLARPRRRAHRAGGGRARRGRGGRGADGRARGDLRAHRSAARAGGRPAARQARPDLRRAARRSRSTPCATSETARRDAWESRSPRKHERVAPT